MKRNKDLARKLARALAKKSPKDKESLLAVGEFLSILAVLYRKSTEAKHLFVNPFVPKEKKLEVLRELAKRMGVPDEVLEVFGYILEINAFPMISEIKRLYDHEVERIMRVSKGELLLASEVDDEVVEKIASSIKEILKRDIDIEVSYDPSLIGGFVFKTSGFVIDASVKRQLGKLLTVGGRI